MYFLIHQSTLLVIDHKNLLTFLYQETITLGDISIQRHDRHYQKIF